MIDTVFIRKIPGFRSGKKWKMALASVVYLFIFLIILSALFGGDTNSGITGNAVGIDTQTESAPKEVVVSKPTTDILPNRNDLSTEWLFYETENITANYTGFESGSETKLRFGLTNIVNPKVYKFSSVSDAEKYYNYLISNDKTLQRGGYTSLSTSGINANCEAYRRDVGFREECHVYCVKHNIVFTVLSSTETEPSQKYCMQIGQIVSQKIS